MRKLLLLIIVILTISATSGCDENAAVTSDQSFDGLSVTAPGNYQISTSGSLDKGLTISVTNPSSPPPTNSTNGGSDTTGGSTDTGSTSGGSDTGGGTGGGTGGAKRIIGYYAQWATYGRNHEPADIPAAQLTHINYAFVELRNNGELYSIDTWADFQKVYQAKNGLPAQNWEQSGQNQAGNFGRLRDLKAKYPHLKVMISLGGWNWNGPFSAVAADATARKTFALSCAQWVSKNGMDGIDIDWEYPAANDKNNFTEMLRAVREQLNIQGQKDGKTYYLSIASAAGEGNMAGFDLAAISGIVDFINVMTYDYHGAWESVTGYNSPLYSDPGDTNAAYAKFNVDWTINAYIKAGAPASKLNIGMALYGRSWEAVPNVNKGLYQYGQGGPSQGIAGNWEYGVLDYWRIVQLTQDSRYAVNWNDTAKAAHLYGPNISSGLAGGMFVTYENPQSLQHKLNYIKGKGLGGAMFWELSGDVRDVNDPNSLIGLTFKGLSS